MILLSWMLACAEPEPCGQDLANSPAGLELTYEEHTSGWGREACVSCHPMGSYHQVDCMDAVDLDTQAMTELEDCAACHGFNGLPQDTAP